MCCSDCPRSGQREALPASSCLSLWFHCPLSTSWLSGTRRHLGSSCIFCVQPWAWLLPEPLTSVSSGLRRCLRAGLVHCCWDFAAFGPDLDIHAPESISRSVYNKKLKFTPVPQLQPSAVLFPVPTPPSKGHRAPLSCHLPVFSGS